MYLSPAHFGVTSYATSTINHDIIKQTIKLGKGLKYCGSAMIEFKLDDRDNTFKYIETNPRIGMCNFFDAFCGRNNVYAIYCLAKSIPFNRTPQKENCIFLSVYEDIYSRYKSGQGILDILRAYISNWNKKHTFAYFVWHDPVPALFMLYSHIRLISKSLNKTIRKKLNQYIR